jgi:hypothetical protein
VHPNSSGGVQEGSGGVLTIDHQIVGKASAQLADRARQETLSGSVFAVAGSIRFGIKAGSNKPVPTTVMVAS